MIVATDLHQQKIFINNYNNNNGNNNRISVPVLMDSPILQRVERARIKLENASGNNMSANFNKSGMGRDHQHYHHNQQHHQHHHIHNIETSSNFTSMNNTFDRISTITTQSTGTTMATINNISASSLSTLSSGPIKRGLLWQQRERLFSRWKERYFILTRDYLQCFKKASGSSGTERISDMGQFLFKIKLVDVEKIEWLNRKLFSIVQLNIKRDGHILLRCDTGLEDWYEYLDECVVLSKERRRILHLVQDPRSRASVAVTPSSYLCQQYKEYGDINIDEPYLKKNQHYNNNYHLSDSVPDLTSSAMSIATNNSDFYKNYNNPNSLLKDNNNNNSKDKSITVSNLSDYNEELCDKNNYIKLRNDINDDGDVILRRCIQQKTTNKQDPQQTSDVRNRANSTTNNNSNKSQGLYRRSFLKSFINDRRHSCAMDSTTFANSNNSRPSSVYCPPSPKTTTSGINGNYTNQYK